MELLTPEEEQLINKHQTEFGAMQAYVFAIRELSHTVDACVDGGTKAVSLFDAMQRALQTHSVTGQEELYASLYAIGLRLKRLAQMDQAVLDARSELLFALSGARQTPWREHDDAWFEEKTEQIRRLLLVYASKADELSDVLECLRCLDAQLSLGRRIS